jgi:hypothetical protein
MFTMDDIIQFQDSKSIPLLGQYNQEALENYIKTKATESSPDTLPEILLLHGSNYEQWFIKKKSMIPLCMKLLGDARITIGKLVAKRWLKLMEDYSDEPAMKNDSDFEQLLSKLLHRYAPVLAALLNDNKLYLVYSETGDVPIAQQIFRNQSLIPLSELLLLERKSIFTDTKILLPFWYSMPIVTAIMKFFTNFSKKKKDTQKKNSSEEASHEGSEDTAIKKDSQKAKLKKSADDFIKDHLPSDKKLDAFLVELQSKWNNLIDEQARKNLFEDVNSLIRDRVRRMLRLKHNNGLTEEAISQMSQNIITDTPVLQQFHADTLTLYIELYIARLVSNIRPS